MARPRGNGFTTIRSEGAILSPDLLGRIREGRGTLEGLDAASYHVADGRSLGEAIARSWNRLRGSWRAFATLRAALAAGDAGIGATRDRWLHPLFEELGYGRLPAARGLRIGDRDYPISHVYQHSPIHMVGVGVDLDVKTAGVAGAARVSPHGLVQDYLNRSDESLYGFVTNGLRFRILRDDRSLTRQTFIEFDLETMLEGEVYADFALFWLLAHQSRIEAERAEDCLLERWSARSREQGTRALDRLRAGVEEAIGALGAGFLEKGNTLLRSRLATGALPVADYYRQLLRLVYRVIFLFVAEDRHLLLDPKAGAEARDRYVRFYSTARLRRMAETVRGTPHTDLYRALRLVMDALGGDEGAPALALPPLGSFLWSRAAVPDLAAADLPNRALLDAIRHLAFTTGQGLRQAVDWRNLGAEELGSVYESLLELHPEVHAESGVFTLRSAAGHERKTSGSYYTPESLIQCLLDTALDPVLDEAASKPDPKAAILALRVCDPACGSGHFLIAAAHRIAKRLARVRTGDDEPAPDAVRSALRAVIGNCLFGVDVNETAVELCKVSLWMEALEAGRPLSFLDHRILCGNSLLGTTPALLAEGIPEAAFEPIEGDDKAEVRGLRRRNKEARQHGQLFLSKVADRIEDYGHLTLFAQEVASLPDATLAEVRLKERRHAESRRSAAYRHDKLLADTWCAAFVCEKTRAAAEPITHEIFERLRSDPRSERPETVASIDGLAARYAFFHWHIAFPDVFETRHDGRPENPLTGWSGGFDVVLSNPPWERVKLEEQQWFASRDPRIAAARNAAERKRMIRDLAGSDPGLHAAFLADLRVAEGESHFLRHSGRFPLCGRGDINTYAVFAETMRQILGPGGRVGCIVPTGIATDDTTKEFFRSLVTSQVLSSLYDFENRDGLFAAVDSRVKFTLLTLAGPERPVRAADFAFFASQVTDLADRNRHFTLTSEDLVLLNPNTRTCPVFRSSRDAEITKAIYRRVPILLREGPPEENPWGVRFAAMFHMANDSGLFRTRDQLETEGFRLEHSTFRRGDEAWLPLYEAKMLHHYNHRFGDYADQPPGSKNTALPDVPEDRLRRPDYSVLPRYWVPAAEVDERLAGRWDRGWLLGWRDICRNTDVRTVIAAVLPRVGVGDKFLLMFPSAPGAARTCLLGNLNSFILDYCSRQKVGGTSLKYFTMKQLPVLPPSAFDATAPWSRAETLASWIRPRVLELAYTSDDMAPFARDLGYDGPPFSWDDERRYLLRCELDAAFLHLYGLSRDDAGHVLDSFPIVRRDDEKRFGEFRTKRVILDLFDALAGDPPRDRQTPLPMTDSSAG